MSYFGDFPPAQILYFDFTTVDSTGLPTTLSGSPVLSVYKDDGTSVNTASITLGVDFNSKTGLNNVKLDTSNDGTFFAAGHDFHVIITTGTVSGISVIGYDVGEFSIDNRPQKVNTTKVSGTTQTARDLGASVLLSSGAGTGQLDFTSGVVKSNQTQVDGVALTSHASGKVPSDVLTIAGTTQTARDIGASVLLSSGAGTGQLDFTSGVVKANLAQILGTAFTEGAAGRIADAFKAFFNIASSTLTTAGINQTGDSYAIVNNGTYGNSALLTAINNINNLSALANLFGPSVLTRPSSGSIVYPFFFTVKNELGQPIDVDGNTVTLTAKNAGGTDRSAGLSSVTHSGTGEYTFTYTVSSSDTDEGLAFTAAGTVLTISRKGYAAADVTDADSLTALAAIQAKTDLLTFTVSGKVDANTLLVEGSDATNQIRDSILNDATRFAGADISEIESETDDIAAVLTNTNTLLSRVGSFTGTGVNTILGFFNSLFRKDSTLSSDIGGTYDNTTMSLEGMYTKIIHIPEGLPKNTAYDNFKFIMRSSVNHITPTAGLTVTAQRCIDDAAWGSCSNNVEDILNGGYSIDLSASDLNGTSILLYFTAPGADPAFYVIKTV